MGGKSQDVAFHDNIGFTKQRHENIQKWNCRFFGGKLEHFDELDMKTII